MDRAQYNACMSPYIKGKDKTKEERKADFCIGAKMCTGKAKTVEEARQICNQPRLPKWAAGKEEEPEQLTCPQRLERTMKTIVEVKDLIKSGQTEKIKEPLVVALQDIHACAPVELKHLANDTLNEVKNITGEFYFKGEGREMVKNLDTLSALLAEGNA